MTATKSLSERLRSASGDTLSMREFRIMVEQRREAADVIDRFEADLEAAREALYTLVSHAALHEEYTSHPTDEDVVQISLGELRRARQALAALRASAGEEQP